MPDELWDRARRELARHEGPSRRSRRATYLFSGLLRCASCGGSVVSHGDGRFGCSNREERGTCDNATRIKLIELESRALAGLQRTLADESLLEEFVAEYQAERRRLAAESEGESARAAVRLKELDRALARLADAIAEAGFSPTLKTKLRGLEAERVALAGAIAAADEARQGAKTGARPLFLKTAILAERRALIESLAERLGEPPQGEAARLVRELTQKIVIGPGKPPQMTLFGTLAALEPSGGLFGSGGGI
ncbi:MAG: zinc ribbon domain-containing protein [Alphaproteobacteria bacterium]|nr:zinc ribbon domain-containing protein [Alphaproteobacteria bacterium]